jgi:2-polyprenyl-6-methoxyphenol hydroxylase-like FAD-dependent oxidoreductase
MTTQTQDGPDAVVIGAGPAGLAVARELDHQHGIKTLVLDRAAARQFRGARAMTTSASTRPGSCRTFPDNGFP